MISSRMACDLIEEFDGVTVKDHFGGDAYSANGRIFATVWHEKKEVNLRLSPEEQRRFLSGDGEGFVEIDNAWGRQGFTKIQLEFVDKKQFLEALKSAWKQSFLKLAKSAAPAAAKKKEKTFN